MPYADRQQQLTYMRQYMKRKRIVNHIAKLKQHKIDLLKRFEEEPYMKYLVSRKEVGSHCDKEVERLEGLLGNGQNCQKLGETRKP